MDHFYKNPLDQIKKDHPFAADTTKPVANRGAGNRDTDRVDAREKVTGAAKFSAEYTIPGIAYGVLVGSTVAKGAISSFDGKAAERAPGVLAVITYQNALKVPAFHSGENPREKATWSGGLKIFYDQKIYYYGQPVALVIADSLERASEAAKLLKIKYTKAVHQTDLHASGLATAANAMPVVYTRGEGDVFRNAPVFIEGEYVIPIEVHNAMEPHATIAVWEGVDQVTVYDKTQGVKSTQQRIAEAFALKEEKVRVITQFVGGAFGSASRTWPHVLAAVLGARQVGRPLKLVLHREQMFNNVGYRPWSIQQVGIGATKEGKLVGITHLSRSQTSAYENFREGLPNVSRFLYACPHVSTRHQLDVLDLSTPTWMRGPGPSSGAFALESALDELSYALDMDPLELRMRNETAVNPELNLPFSSRFLMDCYRMGAEKIGWWQRNRQPRSMQEEGWLVGYGMASGFYGASKSGASIGARMDASGKLILQSAVSDMGAGTTTTMTLIAAQQMGLPVAKIEFQLGDSILPPGPSQVGSRTTSALGSAVHDVCKVLQSRLADLAIDKGHFHNVRKQDIVFRDGFIAAANQKITYAELLQSAGVPSVEIVLESKEDNQAGKFSMYSFSAQFVKVRVHPHTGVVRMARSVVALDAGRIVSEKTAESQMIGGAVGGIGMALTEEAVIDQRFGRIINDNFADYHVPVNADTPKVEVLFVNKPDPVINPLGAKGIGEVAIVGFAPAVTNAIFHATGKRIRQLPVTPDKLIK